MNCKCANCEWAGTDEDPGFQGLEELPRLSMRLDPGSEVPAGACPECGCFCYVVAEPDVRKGGQYSVFLLRDDGTWTQPTYRADRDMTYAEFRQRINNGAHRDVFLVCGLGEDDGADEDCVEEMP